MGGGGLNILPQKSWNVWSAKNREIVARDEARHAAEQEAIQQKQHGVDQEWRVEELRRRKARPREAGAAEGGAAEGGGTEERDGRPFNLFEQEERQHAERGGNTQHEAEKKQREAREARREFRCLGEQADRYGEKRAEPWYLSAPSLPTTEDAVPTVPERPAAVAAAKLAPRAGRKSAVDADPLISMKKLVGQKRRHTEKAERGEKRARLEALRQERQEREQAERRRALELMRSKHPDMFRRKSEPSYKYLSTGGGGSGGRREEREDDGTTRASQAVLEHRERMARRRGDRR